MRYKPGQKEETRQKMLEAASRSFRSHGYAGIGVDGLAKAAGVTSGAFYSHFGSKDSAFTESLVYGLDEVLEGVPRFQDEYKSAWVEAFADYYLGYEHRQDTACGCAMTTLSPEVTRASDDVRQIYEERMLNIAKLIAAGLAGNSDENRLQRAWALIGILTGGLTIARAVQDEKLSSEIASAIRNAAVDVAGKARTKPLPVEC